MEPTLLTCLISLQVQNKEPVLENISNNKTDSVNVVKASPLEDVTSVSLKMNSFPIVPSLI